MKRTALFLLLALLLALAPGMPAEEADLMNQFVENFHVHTVVPDGYRYIDSFVSEILYIGYLRPKDMTLPQALITIAYDEEAHGRTVNELSDEEVLRMVDDFMQDTPDATVEYRETGEGTRLIVFNTHTKAETRIDIVTLWRGYQIACMIFPGEQSKTKEVTQEDLAGIITFLTQTQITQ